MNSELEKDFGYQQKKLSVLREQRTKLVDGSEAAVQADNRISETERLILSYEALRYYE